MANKRAETGNGNLKTAFTELFGFDGEPGPRVAPSKASEAAPETSDAAGRAPVVEDRPSPEAAIPPIDFDADSQDATPVVVPPRGESVITSDTIIIGNIRSASHLKIFGSVNGNIECEGNVIMSGELAGDIKAADVLLQGNMIGSIESSGSIVIEQQATLQGNLTSDSLSCNGAIDGNIAASSSVSIESCARINGDINTRELSVSAGSSIRGSVNSGS